MVQSTTQPCSPYPSEGIPVSSVRFVPSCDQEFVSMYVRNTCTQKWVPVNIGRRSAPTLQQVRDADRNISMNAGSYDDAHFYIRSADGNNVTTAFYTNATGGTIQAGNANGYIALNLQPLGGLLTYGNEEVATQAWVSSNPPALQQVASTGNSYNGDLLLGTSGNEILVGSGPAGKGWGNTRLGSNTLQSLVAAHWNTAIGSNALQAMQYGLNNVAVGEVAMADFVGLPNSFSNNTAVGDSAGVGMTQGIENAFFGSTAGLIGGALRPGGNRNTYIGNAAGNAGDLPPGTTPLGSGNIFLGNLAGAGTVDPLLSYQLRIGTILNYKTDKHIITGSMVQGAQALTFNASITIPSLGGVGNKMVYVDNAGLLQSTAMPSYTVPGLQDVTASGNTTSNSIIVNNSPNTNGFFLGNASGSLRWVIRTLNTETGSNNAGADFTIASRTDAGTSLINAFTIARANGAVNIANLAGAGSRIATVDSLGNLSATSAVPVVNGGTGAASLTGIVTGNGTAAMTAVTGTANQLLRRNSANTAYEFFTPDTCLIRRTGVNMNVPGNTTEQINGAVNDPNNPQGSTWFSGINFMIADNNAYTNQFGANGSGKFFKRVRNSSTLAWANWYQFFTAEDTITPVNGGTGVSTLTGIAVGNGVNAMTGVVGTANQLLRRNATNTAYEFFTPGYLTSVPTLQDVTNVSPVRNVNADGESWSGNGGSYFVLGRGGGHYTHLYSTGAGLGLQSHDNLGGYAGEIALQPRGGILTYGGNEVATKDWTNMLGNIKYGGAHYNNISAANLTGSEHGFFNGTNGLFRADSAGGFISAGNYNNLPLLQIYGTYYEAGITDGSGFYFRNKNANATTAEDGWLPWYQVATTNWVKSNGIQNQFASAQSADAWISGNMRASQFVGGYNSFAISDSGGYWGFYNNTTFNNIATAKMGALAISNDYSVNPPVNGIYLRGSLQLDKETAYYNNIGGGAISFYKSTYKAWQIYMGRAADVNSGAYGNITPQAGTDVTTWALRSYVENTPGYGWVWESGTSTQTAPGIIAELSSSTGNFRVAGQLRSGSLSGGGNVSLLVDNNGVITKGFAFRGKTEQSSSLHITEEDKTVIFYQTADVELPDPSLYPGRELRLRVKRDSVLKFSRPVFDFDISSFTAFPFFDPSSSGWYMGSPTQGFTLDIQSIRSDDNAPYEWFVTAVTE